MEESEYREEVLTRLKTLQDGQESMGKDITRLNTSVMGDEKAGVDGLAKTVKDHSNYIERDKKHKWMIMGAASVFGAAFQWLFGGK